MKAKLLLLLLTAFLMSCTDSAPKRSSTEITELTAQTQNSEVQSTNFINDAANPEEIQIAGGESQTNTKYGTHQSEISTLTDGYGNVTEIRKFKSDKLIKMVVVRTRADGSKQVIVHGQNGEFKEMPEDSYQAVLNNSPSRIADMARIKTEIKIDLPPENVGDIDSSESFPPVQVPQDSTPKKDFVVEEKESKPSVAENSATNKSLNKPWIDQEN